YPGTVGPRTSFDNAGLHTRVDGKARRCLRQSSSQSLSIFHFSIVIFHLSFGLPAKRRWQMRNDEWKMENEFLKRRQVVFAVCAFDQRLALRVVTRGGNSFEATLVDRLTAARADSVTSFLDSQQRLIDIGNDFRTTFSEPQRDLLVQILY